MPWQSSYVLRFVRDVYFVSPGRMRLCGLSTCACACGGEGVDCTHTHTHTQTHTHLGDLNS
jgi:hypothetical protein